MTTLYIDSKKVSALYVDGKKVQLGAQEPQYLTFEPLGSAANLTKITLRNSGGWSFTGTFEAKLNDGAWTTVSWEDVSNKIDYNLVTACDASRETISFGEKLQIRGLDKWNGNCSLKVTCAGGAKVYGKLADSFTPELAASTASNKFEGFFKDSTGLKDASGLDLGDIAITSHCYDSMFRSCTSLTQAPALPATTLAEGCYRYMFYGCTSLTQAPALPATSLAKNCYDGIFWNCRSLTQAPALPATTLAENCYIRMFNNCSSLTQAPALPATALAKGCYDGMFFGCSSLTQAPALPATALADSCYNYMFYGCTNLTHAPALPATSLAQGCYTNMFSYCTNITELHYPASIENNSTFTGMSGSPWFGANNATVYYDL